MGEHEKLSNITGRHKLKLRNNLWTWETIQHYTLIQI